MSVCYMGAHVRFKVVLNSETVPFTCHTAFCYRCLCTVRTARARICMRMYINKWNIRHIRDGRANGIHIYAIH